MNNILIQEKKSSDIREQFPLLAQQINGHPLTYLDNAATTQKPLRVIEAITNYYQQYNANIHRGVHTLAEKATQAFEQTRATIKTFINARSEQEIIFVRGVTEAINLVAFSYGRTFMQSGDEIIVSGMEHHSNIVPWQWVCCEKNSQLRVIPVSPTGEIEMESFRRLLSPRTKLVTISHASNVLGTINPVEEMIEMAHRVGAVVLIDGAQAGGHLPIDVQDLDCDFYCLSAHKMYGPSGVGVLYGKKHLLEIMPPYQGGGEMIREVTFDKTTYNQLPYKFEAGTPSLADVIAFRHALDFIEELGHDNITSHERELLHYATERVSTLPGVIPVGTARNKVGVLSFIIDNVHPFDVGQLLDTMGIAVRTGNHCAQPLMTRYGLEGTVRASFAVYNTMEEVDRLADGVEKTIRLLK